MFINSLDKKSFFKKSDGNIVRDLTQTMFDFRSNNYTSFNLFKLPLDYVMRPDLISQAVYNNTLYAEFILKYNGISNPFSMSPGDLILIPNLESAQQNVKTNGRGEDYDAAKKIRESYKYIDPTKNPKRDTNTDKFDNRKFEKSASNKSLEEGALPPNIAEEGTSQIVERNGRVYFGESIGESACLKSGMSSGEFLTKVIKSKTI